MKTKKPLFRLAALAALSFFTGNEIVAQTNIGAACGCPSYATRPVASITTAGTWTNLPASAYGKELLGNQNVVLTCDKTWTLDEKLYVGAGSTLTIQPGTVIKGAVAGSPAAATALIIERGGKIMAPGAEECPIIFTALADNLTGTYPVSNKGMWGGVLLCGKATNNLTLALNGPFVPGQSGKMAAANGLGVLEGFASSYPQDQFGVAVGGAPSNYTLTTSPAAITGFDYTFGGVAGAGTGSPVSNAAGQAKITLSAANVAIVAGQFVSGTGIPANAQVLSISGATITLNANLTGAVTSGDAITFEGDYPNAGTQAYYQHYTNNPTVMGPLATVGSVVVNYALPSISAFGETFNDDDNSGVMTHVSIRHSGANLLVGSEINGLTLASVGRGTKIEHIEIVSCADDNIEIFGGTVNLKYCTTLFGNDDMYDYDLGWTGKAQFLFGMKADHAGTPNVGQDNDNGFECDGGDGKQFVGISNPTIYNATIVGNAKTTGSADNGGLAAMNFKEGAGGTVRNSVFAGFKNGVNFENSVMGTGNTVHNAYHNWTTESIGAYAPNALKVKCNTFIGTPNPITLGASNTASNTAALATGMQAQFVADSNYVLTPTSGTSIAGFDYGFAINGTTNAITTKNDVVPNNVYQVKLSASCPQAPMDGFFSPANYRGAFKPSANNENWLSDWTYSQVLNSTSGVSACPTDINNDGTTDVNDFLIFSGEFGNACN
jgi:hypothetical protein